MTMQAVPATVQLEDVDCPMGCARDDEVVMQGRDRLHDLPGEYTIVRCRHCSLMRTTPRPTADTIGFYYPDTYGPYVTTRVSEQREPVAPRTPGRLVRLWPALFEPKTHAMPPMQPGRALEIGCGSGSFMHQLAGQGWSVEGVEFSPTAAQAARDLGYHVCSGSLETAPPPAEPLDLVVGWMVLEHLHEPVAALRKLASWSKPGAYLVASVPDASAPEFGIFGPDWYALHLPAHLYHYTPQTLRALLAAGGWRLQRVLWHDNPNNLLLSLEHRWRARGRTARAELARAVALGQRWPRSRFVLGKVMGALRASGRMTVWATRA